MSRFGLTLLLVSTLGWSRSASAQMEPKNVAKPQHSSRIVFVCEHGAALSVVSAAYFNKLAKEENLDIHAIARGTEPQVDLSVSARAGLTSDGIPFETKHPQKLSTKDAVHAHRIVAFCRLPAKYSKLAPVETWNDVPLTAANYGRARDAILTHLQELIRQLKSENPSR